MINWKTQINISEQFVFLKPTIKVKDLFIILVRNARIVIINLTFDIVLRLAMDWFLLCYCNTTRASRNYDYKPTFLFNILTTLFLFNSVLIKNTISLDSVFYNLYILIACFDTETYVPISWTTEPILSYNCYFKLKWLLKWF